MIRYFGLTTTLLILAITFIDPGSIKAGEKDKTTSLQQLSNSVELMMTRITPAVVQINIIGFGLSSQSGGAVAHSSASGGSGFIIDPNGYIITNAHVVADAQVIEVVLNSLPTDSLYKSIIKPQGEPFAATLVGLDRETDLAVLKIYKSGLPSLKLADSDNIRQGQIVFALGSPFGLQNSVTMGVLSSTARQLSPDDRMIYLQTDAAINPGNSGGPLVNTDGEVVGVNTFIISKSGGNEGIGFAAPSNIVDHVYKQIRANGRVRRGVIGVAVQSINPLLAEGLSLPRNYGVIVSNIDKNGSAAKSDLQVGDIIVSMNGKLMENGRQFDVNIYQQQIGDSVELEIIHQNKNISIFVKITERSDDPTRFAELVTPKGNLIPKLGILGIPLDRRVLEMLPPLRNETGVLVAALSADHPLVKDGLQPGDVIYSINNVGIAGLSRLRSVLDRLAVGQPIVLQVERFGKLHYVSFRLR